MTNPLPRPLAAVRNAQLPDGRVVDVSFASGVVSAITTAGTGGALEPALDLRGRLLLPAPAEPHAHLDKARSFDAADPKLGDLGSAIDAWRAHASAMSVESIVERARAQALAMLAAGTTAIRSHVDVLEDCGAGLEDVTRAARALVQVRAELAGLMDIQLVALAGPHCPDHHVEAVLDAGIELVGGAPHLAPDPAADLARLLAIAQRRGIGADLHADENLAGPVTLDAYARAVRDWPDDRPRTASHCVRLGTLEPARRDAIIADVKAADLAIVTLPITNLYLQGWEHPVSTPRGLAPLRELLDAGVRLGAGADNVRDPFNPVGRGDALETASLLVTAGHLSPEEAYGLVSTGARSVMGLPAAGTTVGAPADFLAIRAVNLVDAIATAPADRIVIHRGRVVAITEARCELPALSVPVS
ncbi:cytosine deaminase [Amycolatopsis mediterranei S699]|uniref:Cytosine deaminase n=2 Tax=Amycolatopsis mediterranei TaxID=33910 RepID=A0A0H3D0F8_AMYMU|nr:amidohydrolase family protein [Amycolatopsis mediterranei]ADJ43805.1 cytosine deaminase [Amycolatopsis mediterranei U32]AEK40516.1 cytosine deaminase [Amycolatopsis mediterranei S699]AFO75518.1 cytosine deaminase [Amycolatopsis mediterranei S699]AGT82647.1 cytosine deaminase [Amycolatopsis mediterranei RB]KDO09188.1 cytosine deaminase [Amycolatopsis mediterranei]